MKDNVKQILNEIHKQGLANNQWNIETEPKPWSIYESADRVTNHEAELPPHIAIYEDTDIDGKDRCDYYLITEKRGKVHIWVI